VTAPGLSLDQPFPDEAHNFLLQQCKQLILMSSALNVVAGTATTGLTASQTDRLGIHTQLDATVLQLANAVLAASGEITNRTNADTALGARIDTQTSNLASEVTRATSTEAGLRTDLTTADTRAKTAEGTLTGNLATEVTARTKGDSDEATARAAADTTLGNRATALETRASNIETAATALTTRVTATETKNGTQDTDIATLKSQVSALQTQVATNTSTITALQARVLAMPPFAAGNAYGPLGGAFTFDLPHGELQFVPIYVPPGSAPIKAIACEVTAAGGAGRVVRMGIWQDTGSGAPGALLRDAGTKSVTTIGGQVSNLATALDLSANGAYVWVGVAAQVASGYATTVRVPTLRGVIGHIPGVRSVMSGESSTSLVAASTFTGAFTANPAVGPDITGGPRLTLIT
jgi:uncharacterized coiled-coil protein SlyX